MPSVELTDTEKGPVNWSPLQSTVPSGARCTISLLPLLATQQVASVEFADTEKGPVNSVPLQISVPLAAR